MLSGLPLMVQAVAFNGALLDPLSPFDDGRRTSEVGIGRRDIAEALVVVALDGYDDLGFENPGQIIVLQQHSVYQRLMPELGLALGLWLMRCTANMIQP